MVTRWMGTVLVVVLMGSCAGTPENQEPVEIDGDVMIPDLPGAAGETDKKPAGQSQADVDPIGGESTEAGTSDSSAVDENENYYVSSYSLSVRSGPGMSHEIIDHLTRGERVKVLEKNGIWIKIGDNRYVSSKHVSSTRSD